MSEAWRCFVAAPIGEELTARLSAALDDWRGRPDLAGLRWSEPANWHLTFAFIGDVEAGRVEGLADRLREVASRSRATRVRTGGLGGFPSAARARVAWYGVDDPQLRLRELAGEVGRAVDLEADRPFNAHVTLGRARGPALDLRSWVSEADAPAGWLTVDRLELVRSMPGGGPVHYLTLASAALGSPEA